MRDAEITSQADLDAALAGSTMHKNERLWTMAEGRWFRWPDLIALIAGALLVVVGFARVFSETQSSSAILLVLGTVCLGGHLYRRQQSQIDALRELLKRMDRGDA